MQPLCWRSSPSPPVAVPSGASHLPRSNASVQAQLGFEQLASCCNCEPVGRIRFGFDWADEVDLRFAEFAERLGRNEPALDIVLIQEA